MKLSVFVFMATVSADILAASPTITINKVAQRYPWNGLVDFEFTVGGDAGAKYSVDFCAMDNEAGTNLVMNSIRDADGKDIDLGDKYEPGTYTWSWDASKDVGDGYHSERLQLKCAVDERLWMVAVPDSGKVVYRAFVPVSGWSAIYGNSAIVLRKIDAGSFYMGSPSGESGRQSNEDYHNVNMTKAYYISVTPLTVAQKSAVQGQDSDDGSYSKLSYIALRGDDVVSTVTQSYVSRTLTITQKKTATSYSWPGSSSVLSSSLIGKLRTKFGLNFDLPTEAQWEFARANDDSYGLVGMRGTSGEWCLDAYKASLGTSSVSDPKGPAVSYELKSDLLGNWAPSGNGSKHCLYFNGQQYIFDGNSGDAIVHYAHYNAYGVRRVVKGLNSRKAYRTSAYNLNTSGVIFTEGVMMKNYHGGSVITRKKAAYTNPSYCYRVVVPAE